MSSTTSLSLSQSRSKGADSSCIEYPQQPHSASYVGSQTRKRHQSPAVEQSSRKKRKSASCEGDDDNAIAPFVSKTKEMISKCDEEYPDVAAWSADGDRFYIKDQKKFAEEIIPQYFDATKFPSFVRQLNFYGFRKVQTTAIYKKDQDHDHVTFKNEFFHRDKPELLKKIKRLNKQKGGQNNESVQEINALKERVACLEQTIQLMQQGFKDQFEAFKNEMLSQHSTATYSSGQHAVPNTNYSSGQHAVPNTNYSSGQHAVLNTNYSSGRQSISNPRTYQNVTQDNHSNCIKTQLPLSDDLNWRNENEHFDPVKVQEIIDHQDVLDVHQPPQTEEFPCNEENDLAFTKEDWDLAFTKEDWDFVTYYFNDIESHSSEAA